MQYKISVIIPIHNIEKYLEQTLDSLLNQTIDIADIEVIMIDDCSTDNSGEIMDIYAGKYDNFIAVHLTENCGLPGKPRNIGLEMATGEYVMFMDHDDYYSCDTFEVFYNKITTENADVIFSRYNYVFQDGRIEHNPRHFEDIDEIKITRIDEYKQLLDTAPSIWTKMFRREFLIDNNVRFPEGMLAEDLSFVVHSFLKANGIVYLNNYFSYNYRIRDSEEDKSTIHIRNKKYLMDMINGYYNTYDILKTLKREEYFSIFFKEHLSYWMDCFILSNAKPSEKIELLEKIQFFYVKLEEYQIELNRNYMPLIKDILNKNFQEVILIADIMAKYQKQLATQKKQLIKQRKQLTNHRKQLATQKKRIAELQTTSGWLKYKTRNIVRRLKRKLINNSIKIKNPNQKIKKIN